MNHVLREILRTGNVTSPAGEALKAEPVSIPEEKGEFLLRVLDDLKPANSLEVGLAYGVSTLFICDALAETKNARHIVIDPDQNKVWGGIGLNNLREAGFDSMIEFYEEPSYRVLPRLEMRGRKVEFAFIDGWHTFDYALVDFFFADKLLEVGGVVVIDDTDWPAIRRLCRYIVTNHQYEPFCMTPYPPDGDLAAYSVDEEDLEAVRADRELGLWGECIAFKKKSEDVRRWDFFSRF